MKTIFLVRWSASRVSITLPYNLDSVIKSVLCLGVDVIKSVLCLGVDVIKSVLCLGVDVSPGLQDIIVSYF